MLKLAETLPILRVAVFIAKYSDLFTTEISKSDDGVPLETFFDVPPDPGR